MNSIIFSWKLQKGSYLEAMTIPPKHIDFAKDNLACNILLQKMMLRVEVKLKMMMVNDHIGAWGQCLKYVLSF